MRANSVVSVVIPGRTRRSRLIIRAIIAAVLLVILIIFCLVYVVHLRLLLERELFLPVDLPGL